MRVTMEYKLPEESFMLKCAEEGLSNRMLLESIKTTLEAHQRAQTSAYEVVQDLIAQMRGFK